MGPENRAPAPRRPGCPDYRQGVHRVLDRLPMLPFTLRAALALFVVAWIFGVHDLRSTIPVWVAFVIALGLEINFFLGALTRPPAPRPDRGPQPIDRERFGYLAWPEDEGDEEYEDDELWEDESRWPAVRRFLWGVGIIAALALTFWLVDRNTGWDSLSTETRAEAQERFSAEASRIAEKDVRIRCDESGEYVGAVQHADGVAQVGGELAYLTPERCLDLYRLAFEDEVTGSQTGRAVSVLAHEAWHLRGEGNEGTTECYAIQSGVELGRRLGLSEDEAHRLMAQQLAENSGRGIATAEYRVPPECRDGGSLDLDPGSSRFP
jgi:hypothetical protein